MDETYDAVGALTRLFMSRPSYFEKLAATWLDAGVSSFEVTSNREVLGYWGENCADHGSISAPLEYGDETIGQLKVTGLGGQASLARLLLDAENLEAQTRFELELGVLTSELVQEQDQIIALYELSKSMRRYLSPEDTLASICREAARLCNCGLAFAILAVSGKPVHLTTFPIEFISPAEAQNLLAKAGQEKRPLVLNQGYAGTCNLLFVPIWINNLPIAGLGLAHHPEGFTAPLLKLAQAITQLGGAQLENSVLYQESLAQAKLKSEMDLAANIQTQLLPRTSPSVAGLDIAAKANPARAMGGDFYNFSNQAGCPFSFVVGDVSGKGASAALMMAMARIIVRNASRFGHKNDPYLVMERVNIDLYEDCSELSMFITAFYGQYDPQSRRVSFVNAGHSPVIYCPAEGAARYLEADGPAVGVLPDLLSEKQELILHPGDLLVIGTDGFSEAFDPQGNMFGYEQLLALVENKRKLNSQELIEYLFQEVALYEAGTEQSDDRTMLVLKGC